MTKKIKVNFWVQSSKSKKCEEELLVPAEEKDDEEALKARVEEWAPEVFPMFHFTDARVSYGYELLEEVEMSEFRLSMSHAGESGFNDRIIYVEFSAEITENGKFGPVYQGEITERKIKRLFALLPKTVFQKIEISTEEFGYAVEGEITQETAFQVWEVLED